MKRQTFLMKLLFPLLLAFLFSACALTDSSVRLRYEPITQPQEGKEGRISVSKFQDTRPDKRVIGEVRNGNLKHTADVIVENQDVSKWVTEALVSELSRAGFTVDEAANETSAETVPQVKGVLTEIFLAPDADFSCRCSIKADIEVDRDKKTVLNKQFIGKGESKAVWSAKKAEEASLKLALQNLMTQVVSEIRNVLKD